MRYSVKMLYFAVFIAILSFSKTVLANEHINIPILCYHNFNPTVSGSMNLTPDTLETQIKWLKANGFTVIPLKQAAEYLQGKRSDLPAKPVVITADDGWQSDYTYLYPIAKKYNVPMTLFIYPETVSEGKHALTWNEIKELQKTGLFDIQGHTFTHPNFKQEKRHLSSAAYEKFVTNELAHSKKILEEKLGTKIDYLAWPFGIYDDYLEQEAKDAGYAMSFSIDAEPANRSYRPMAQPRYMILQKLSMKSFESILNGAVVKSR